MSKKAYHSFIRAHFEARVHYYLPASLEKQKKAITWVDHQPKTIKLPKFGKIDTNHAFNSIQECMSSDMWEVKVNYCPLSQNQKLVDSWMCVGNRVFLFQITIAESKRVVIKEAIEFFAKYSKRIPFTKSYFYTCYQKTSRKFPSLCTI